MDDNVKLIDVLVDPKNLQASLNQMMSVSGWKPSVQKLYMHQLDVYDQIRKEILSKSYVPKNGNGFILNENGKLRYIQTLQPKDILVQHTLTNFILIPILSKYIIYDNGASLKHKGLSFTRKRLEAHLHKFYRKHGLNGYILIIDFRKYFDNIRHDKMMEELKIHIHDQDILDIIEILLKHYEVDVSYSDNENIIDELYNSLAYQQIPKDLLTKERFMAKSLGIGSPVSQILGVYFPSKIDQYVKTVEGVKYYSAYMDDRIVIHESKEYLQYLLEKIKIIADDLGIIINKNKTHIFPIHKSFTFLKTKYTLKPSGKLIKNINKKMLTRERRKLHILADIVINLGLEPDLFINQYRSWRGDKVAYKTYNQLKYMDYIYYENLIRIYRNRDINW